MLSNTKIILFLLNRTKRNELKLHNLSLRYFLVFFVFGIVLWNGCKQSTIPQGNASLVTLDETSDAGQAEKWADSIIASQSLEDRLGQLFMVAAYSNRDQQHADDILQLIEEEKIGGLIFFQGGPGRQARLTNLYQSKSDVPLLIGMDAEWGLGMRLDSTMNFPKQMTLGALADNQLIYDMGAQIAKDCKRLGVHVNFAPVVDVNVNPNNPIIGVRSFGEDKEMVAEKGIAYMKGLQDHGIMANAKHFPGHGDTDMDSHLSLPVIPHDKERLATIEQYPFRKLFEAGLKSIMVAHVHMPAYDDRKNQATTLSKAVVTDLLKNELQFKGLIFTDALNMKGVASFYEPGEVDLLALLAGNDILLFAEDVPTAKEKILHAVKKGKITEEEINERVKKILLGKYWAGLHAFAPIETKGLYEDLNSRKAEALLETLYEKSFVTVKNDDGLLPVKDIDGLKVASVCIGDVNTAMTREYLDKYTSIEFFQLDENVDANEAEQLKSALKGMDLVLLSMHKDKTRRKSTFRFSRQAIDLKDYIEANYSTITTVLANPYSLKQFGTSKTLLYGHISNAYTQRLFPQVIFGAIGTSGKLPVSPSEEIKVGAGIDIKPIDRIGYHLPENKGLDSKFLTYVDSIAMEAINDSATPGCQILVARRGSVVYNKSFGFQTYDRVMPVTDSTIYDLASVTKIVAALPALMFIEERGEVDLSKKFSEYLPELKGTNKEHMTLINVLTHQAGLKGYLQHWKKTQNGADLSPKYYCTNTKGGKFCNLLMPGMYTLSSMEDSLWKWTVDSRLRRKDRRTGKYHYKYSDLAFYMVKRLLDKQLNQPLDEFMAQNFYAPLGIQHMGYKPLEWCQEECIAPTELDTYFRKTQVRGTVHDQGAAMIGGVAGHAGVFGNADDVVKILQMYLNDGTYGGKKYLKSGTVEKFATQQFAENKNRRGIGFDKPEPHHGGPTSQLASKNTFGHSGFTGIGVWVDPDFDLIYVFMSNRVYPDAGNRKLISHDIRTRIHDVIYESIFEFEKSNDIE